MSIDENLLAKQREAIKGRAITKKVSPMELQPSSIAHTHPSPILENKKIGCLLMAGGQATRLGIDAPKGVIPVSPLKHKSLLQIIAEKIAAFSKCYKTAVPLAIMTSRDSKGEIIDHFEKNDFFGLKEVSFFAQPSLPLLDMNGELFFDETGEPLQGPDGNGSLFSTCLPAVEQWANIDALSIIQVDNPLIDPFHPAVLSPIFSGHDFVAAAIARADLTEPVGLFVEQDGRTAVVEYSEIDPNKLDCKWANISFFAATPDFAKKAALHKLPLHTAKKNFRGNEVWKAEYFIFDHLPFAENPAVIPIDRSLFFAPIKNKKGKDSIESAQRAMIERDRARLQELGRATEEAVELPQGAYYTNN